MIDMAIYKNTVDVPQKTSIKKSGNHRYVYYIYEHYQTKNGNWSHRDKAIGRLNEEEPKTMFPNDHYFDLFNLPHPREKNVNKFLDSGHTHLLNERAEELQLTKALKEVFPEDYQKLLTTAFYMVCEGNVMMYLDDFYESSDLPFDCFVSEKHLNEVYQWISKEKIWEFFKTWIDLNKTKNDVVAYDVTSISIYSENLEFAQMGYNRDHEKLEQINVGLLYSQKLNLPLCYELYDGSIPDKVHIGSMLNLAKEFGLSSVIFVMDRGFITSNNLDLLHGDGGIQFIIAFPSSQNIYEAILLSEADHIRSAENYSVELECYGHKKEVDIEGHRLYACSYFNTEKARDEEVIFGAKLKRDEEALTKSLGKKKRKKRLSYFNTEVENEILKSYEKDLTAITESWKILGMFGILTNVEALGWEEVLTLYRQRDRIEKNYDSMKNNIDFSRFRTHNDQSAQGKFFIGFLAQILQADLCNHLGTESKKPVSSTKKLLNEMRKVRKVNYNDRETKLMAPLSRKQKDILALFDMDEGDFVRTLFAKNK